MSIPARQHRYWPATGSGTGIDAGISSSIEVRIGCHLDVNICVSTSIDRCRRLCRSPLNLASVSVSCAAPYARSALLVAVQLLHRRCIYHCIRHCSGHRFCRRSCRRCHCFRDRSRRLFVVLPVPVSAACCHLGRPCRRSSGKVIDKLQSAYIAYIRMICYQLLTLYARFIHNFPGFSTLREIPSAVSCQPPRVPALLPAPFVRQAAAPPPITPLPRPCLFCPAVRASCPARLLSRQLGRQPKPQPA